MTGRDVTAAGRTEVDQALARISERYRELVERLPAVVYEAEPGPEGVFRYVSPQIEQLLGYSPEEWTSNPRLWLERLHPDDRPVTLEREREHALHATGTDTRVRSEYRMVHRDGHVVTIRDEARLIDPDSGPPVWHGVLIDMSASRAASARLNAPGGDAVRANCARCGASWIAERVHACPECGNREVDAVSLNEALAALAASRRQVEDLLAALHRHLDALSDALPEPPPGGAASADARG
ncbi:MAG TPA: PAS domain-containing protein [Solirubrobacterales bacterium]|nr:PAS domain-containing protein [Solirubrobacterales bacterium]